MSDFFINRIKDTKHIYIDGTFIVPREFLRILIILFYDDKLCKRYPGAYIVMNSKKESSYIIVLKDFLRLIKYDIKDGINLLSYTTDFEIGLINACTLVFGEKIRSVGCLFHFG